MSAAKAASLLFITGVIQREGLAIPFDVPEYEVAVLREIHGEDDVIEDGEHEMSAGERTAATEYARLMSRYGGHVDQVRRAFRSVRELARASGLPYEPGDDAAVRSQQAEERVGGKSVAKGKNAGKAKNAPAEGVEET